MPPVPSCLLLLGTTGISGLTLHQMKTQRSQDAAKVCNGYDRAFPTSMQWRSCVAAQQVMATGASTADMPCLLFGGAANGCLLQHAV